jgi:uncharacterized membrane protein
MYRYGFFGHGHDGPHVLGILFIILLFIAVATLVMAAYRWWHHAPIHAGLGGYHRSAEAAISAAQLRYARGEISREKYVRISTDLGAPPPAAPAPGPPTPVAHDAPSAEQSPPPAS